MLLDALVVGGGPAGAAVARLLVQAGWSVALVEKTAFPRRKVCGEFISAPTLPLLAACGVERQFAAAAGPPVTRLGVYAGYVLLSGPSAPVWGRALGREHLDTMLRDAAVAGGARLFQPAEVVALRPTGQGQTVTLRGDGGEDEVAARIVIAACGSWQGNGIFAVESGTPAPSDLFAFKAHFHGASLPAGLMPLLAFPGGYGGLVQSDAGRLSLSCCIRRDALAAVRSRHGGRAGEAVLAHIRATTRGAAQALDGAALEGAFLSTGPIRPGIRARARPGIYFAGNIAGEAHPVIAEGISMAIQSAWLLAALLLAGRGEDYAAAWKRHFGLRLRTAAFFAHLAMGRGGRTAALAVLRACPSLMGWAARASGKTAIST